MCNESLISSYWLKIKKDDARWLKKMQFHLGQINSDDRDLLKRSVCM